MGFWQIAKGNGVLCLCRLDLYDIEYSTTYQKKEYSTFALISKRIRGERGFKKKKKKEYEHTYRRLGGVLLTLYDYTYGVSIGFILRLLLVVESGGNIYIYIYI